MYSNPLGESDSATSGCKVIGLPLAAAGQSCMIKMLTTSVFHSELPSFPGRTEHQADWDRAHTHTHTKKNNLRIHEKKGKCSLLKWRSEVRNVKRAAWLKLFLEGGGACPSMQNMKRKWWQIRKITDGENWLREKWYMSDRFGHWIGVFT